MSTALLPTSTTRVAAMTTVNKPPEKVETSQEKTEASSAKKKKARTPTPLPARLKYPRQWKDLKTKGIYCAGEDSQLVIRAVPGNRTFITCIVFTVEAETNVRFGFGNYGSSGPMSFGGTDEPRAIVMSLGESPVPCGSGDFTVASDGSGGTVAGFCVFYQEPDEVP
jgi:hypothetical protein